MRLRFLASALALLGAAGPALAADGALDPAFLTDAEFPGFGFYVNPNGSPTFSLDWVGSILEAGDGKIWVVGRMRAPVNYRVSLYRVRADGYPDTDFGDLGLRTVVGPCTGFNVVDAVLDSQQRIVAAIDGCGDFLVYRFLPNGDLDTGLAGSGVLSIPFDLGGTNDDTAFEIAVAANDDIVIAGSVAAAGTRRLGIARYTSAGAPAPGFGVAGKVNIAFEWSVSDVIGLTGLHVMDDGRIVADGQISETTQAVSDDKQFVVRLLANGAVDPAFGNSAPGISKINLKSPLGLTESPTAYGSTIERGGAVIQVGRLQSNNPNSSGDMFLLRWRADGQPDLGVGPSGTRQYALDINGPNPSDPGLNSDSASNIVRQSDGKWLIVGNGFTAQGHYAATILRLKRNFDIDPTFGSAGRVQHLAPIATDGDHGLGVRTLLQRPGRLIVGGVSFTGINGRIQTMVGMQNDLLFADGLD